MSLFTEHWTPKIVGELNGQHVKLVKVQGEFTWHHHADEDELFLVLHGTLTIKLRDRDVVLQEGEFFIVPRAWNTNRSLKKKHISYCLSRTRCHPQHRQRRERANSGSSGVHMSTNSLARPVPARPEGLSQRRNARQPLFGNFEPVYFNRAEGSHSGTWTAKNISTTGSAMARSCWGTVIPL